MKKNMVTPIGPTLSGVVDTNIKIPAIINPSSADSDISICFFMLLTILALFSAYREAQVKRARSCIGIQRLSTAACNEERAPQEALLLVLRALGGAEMW